MYFVAYIQGSTGKHYLTGGEAPRWWFSTSTQRRNATRFETFAEAAVHGLVEKVG